MIKLTELAKSKIIEIAESESIGHLQVRVKIVGGGCAGFTHDMYYDDVMTDMDEVFEFDTIKVIIDPISAQYLDDVEIDYLESPLGGGFKFLNAAVTGSCGCGNSVSF